MKFSTSNIPKFEIEKVASVYSCGCKRLFLARSISARDSVEISSSDFPLQLRMTGVIKPSSMPTAIPISMRTCRLMAWPVNDTLISGWRLSAIATALISKSVTEGCVLRFCGTGALLCVVARAMAFRIWLSGWSTPADSICVGGAGAFTTSSSTIRPPGPVPVMVERSIPRSAARVFARGETMTRVPCGLAGEVGAGPAAGGMLVLVPPPTDGAAVIVSVNAEVISSSAPPMTPINVPDITVAPFCTRILRRIPEAKASRSMMALSVSISASASPACTESPSRFFQARRTPSSIVSVNFGITTRLAIKVPHGC